MPDVIPISDAVSEHRYQPGDIIAFYGTDWLSRAIEVVTWGPSHVGIVAEWPMSSPDGTANVLIESTTMCVRPCIIQQRQFGGVQAQWPRLRINDYAGRAKIFRLRNFWRLKPDEIALLHEALNEQLGLPYDYRGALWSGSRILKYLPRMPYSDLGTLFCSELIAGTLQRLGRLCIANAGYHNPGSLVNALVKSGVYLPGVPV